MSIHLTNAMANYLTLFDFGGPVGKRIAERAIGRNTLYPLSCGDNSEKHHIVSVTFIPIAFPDRTPPRRCWSASATLAARRSCTRR